MAWSDTLTIVIAAIAVLIAAGSLWISRRAHQISVIQALPRVSIVRTWSSTGERDLYISLEHETNRPDWMVRKATIKRSWRTCWRRRPFLARGEVIAHDQTDFGEIIPRTRRTSDWQRRINYDYPIAGITIFLHPAAPDCYLTLEITLNTSPSPTIKRHIKSHKESTFQRRQQIVVE